MSRDFLLVFSVYTTAVWLSRGGGRTPYVIGMSHPTTLEPGRSSRVYRSFRYLRSQTSHMSKSYSICIVVPKLSAEHTKIYVPGNVVFGVFTVVGKSTKQVAFVSHKRKTVAKTRTWWGPIFRVLCFQFFPFPSAGL